MADVWKLVSLTSVDLELIILPGIGGRLWDVVFQGHSLLFQNPDLKKFLLDPINPQDFPTRSPQFGFPLWGGEKTWIAPDTNWPDGSPYTTLDSGVYEIIGASPDHIALQSAVCPDSGLQIRREIQLTEGASWTIQHSVTNHGFRRNEVGIWSVMMLDHSVSIGVAGKDIEATKVFGHPKNAVSIGKEGLICDCGELSEFKVGIRHDNSHTFIRVDQDAMPVWMSCETCRATPGDRFAHMNPLEVFNSGDYRYCEAEWHAPLRSLSPGETAEFTQTFSVWTDKPPFSPTETEMKLMSCMF